MDALVVRAIQDDQIMHLIDLDDVFIRNAAIDGLWQLLMLEGAKQITPLSVDFLSYEAPSYFSMIVALYHPTS
jgi:aromatic ring-opening dioxygenase LigB subunit